MAELHKGLGFRTLRPHASRPPANRRPIPLSCFGRVAPALSGFSGSEISASFLPLSSLIFPGSGCASDTRTFPGARPKRKQLSAHLAEAAEKSKNHYITNSFERFCVCLRQLGLIEVLSIAIHLALTYCVCRKCTRRIIVRGAGGRRRTSSAWLLLNSFLIACESSAAHRKRFSLARSRRNRSRSRR